MPETTEAARPLSWARRLTPSTPTPIKRDLGEDDPYDRRLAGIIVKK